MTESANPSGVGVAEYSLSSVTVTRVGAPPSTPTRQMSAGASAPMRVNQSARPSGVKVGWLS